MVSPEKEFIRQPGYYGKRLWLAVCLALLAPCASAMTLQVPISFNTGFLTRLLGETVFNKQAALSVWGDASGCNDLTLSDAVVTVEEDDFYIISNASARTGIAIGEHCVPLLRWQGKVKALQRTDVIDPAGRIAFSTVDTELLNSDNQRATISNQIWDLAKDYVYPHYDRFSIDLTSAIDELRELLPLFLGTEDIEQSRRVIESFHLESIATRTDGLSAMVNFDLLISQSEVKPLPEKVLDQQEIAAFIDTWQRWDAFLGFIIKVAARNTMDHGQRDQLLDTLIETRYSLVEVLGNDATGGSMTVRQSFIQAWHQLGPVFRNISLEVRGAESLRFLGFIAAADAIDVLDQLGPVTGWDVSVDGLRRMARLLIDSPDQDPVYIDPEVDREMRELFDFGPALELPPLPSPQIDSENETEGQQQSLLHWLSTPARAERLKIKDLVGEGDKGLNQMVPDRDNLDLYLDRMNKLLQAVSDATLQLKPLDAEYHPLFSNLVLATAWQETCWRQYRKRNGKIKPMTSSAGALGLMQIMPVVWRGFYDKTSLANDVEYNAAAGSEILHRYLVRYAIRKGEHKHKGGKPNLARATYAAYHGGPRHLSRYRNKDTARSLAEIDQSFWQKYVQVRKGNALQVKQCYPYG